MARITGLNPLAIPVFAIFGLTANDAARLNLISTATAASAAWHLTDLASPREIGLV